MKRIFQAAFFIAIATVAASAQFKSVYTDLIETKCKTLESIDDEGGSYLGECKDVAGYKLQVAEGDLRQTVNVIAPGGKKFELGFWNLYGGFSSVGPRAEWRMKGKTPVALIVRYNVSENPEDASKTTSYLLISKIGPTLSCITGVASPGKTQNTLARQLADSSARRECRASN